VQAFRGRRAGAGGCCLGFEGEQIGHRVRGGWEFKVGSVDDFGSKRAAASYVNGLGSMMGFMTSGAAGGSGLGAAHIFCTRELVAGIIDHFVGTYLWCGVRTEPGNLARNYYDDEKQEGLENPTGKHAWVRENTVRGFAGQARAGAGDGGTDGGDELLPSRGPLDQELGRVVQITKLDRVFELESVGH
jgi:hypothetical protein